MSLLTNSTGSTPLMFDSGLPVSTAALSTFGIICFVLSGLLGCFELYLLFSKEYMLYLNRSCQLLVCQAAAESFRAITGALCSFIIISSTSKVIRDPICQVYGFCLYLGTAASIVGVNQMAFERYALVVRGWNITLRSMVVRFLVVISIVVALPAIQLARSAFAPQPSRFYYMLKWWSNDQFDIILNGLTCAIFISGVSRNFFCQYFIWRQYRKTTNGVKSGQSKITEKFATKVTLKRSEDRNLFVRLIVTVALTSMTAIPLIAMMIYQMIVHIPVHHVLDEVLLFLLGINPIFILLSHMYSTPKLREAVLDQLSFLQKKGLLPEILVPTVPTKQQQKVSISENRSNHSPLMKATL